MRRRSPTCSRRWTACRSPRSRACTGRRSPAAPAEVLGGGARGRTPGRGRGRGRGCGGGPGLAPGGDGGGGRGGGIFCFPGPSLVSPPATTSPHVRRAMGGGAARRYFLTAEV